MCHICTLCNSPLAPDGPEAKGQVGQHGADESCPVKAQLTSGSQAHTSHDGDQAQHHWQGGGLTQNHPGHTHREEEITYSGAWHMRPAQSYQQNKLPSNMLH